MTDPVYTAGAEVLTRRAGLRLDPTLRSRIDRCIAEAAADAKLSLEKYVVALESDRDLLQDLLNRVTVQETAFFRDAAQYRAFADVVIGELPKGTTIWSAGCANGQEAYSIAMALIEAGRTDVRVIASDISTQALARARRGWYKSSEVRGLDKKRMAKYMVTADDGFEVIPQVRNMVMLQRVNLTSDRFPIVPGGCHVVFCRNVLIYFTREEVQSFLDRLGKWMAADGYLFLGYSESLWQVTTTFALTRVGDAFVYRPSGRRVAITAAAPATPAAPAKRRPAQPAEEPAPALPAIEQLLADGEASLAAGNPRAATEAFRRAVYLDPDHPIAHFQLGVAQEAAGHRVAARRAYSAARAAVDRGDTSRLLAALEGYSADALVAILDGKLEALR